MTNEEKANEITKDYLIGHDRANITYEEMMGACLDVAEWKDEQFKGYLEKKKRSIDFRSDWLGYHYEVCSELINEIINEFFKED